jgi:streptogramin lyase
MSAPSAVALDQAGNVWIANAGYTSVAKVTIGGTVSIFAGGGLSLPQSISIDGQGNAWLANAGKGLLSEFANDGTVLSGTGFASAGGTPIAVGITPN